MAVLVTLVLGTPGRRWLDPRTLEEVVYLGDAVAVSLGGVQ